MRCSRLAFALGLLPILIAPSRVFGEAKPAAVSAFTSYVNGVEARLDRQHQSKASFLAQMASDPQNEDRLRKGEPIIEELTPRGGGDLPDALLHDWRGTAFVPGAKAGDFERLLRDFNAYPQRFSPQVLQAKVVAEHGDHLEASMRVRQKHVLTVVLDSTYDVIFGRLDAQNGYSASRSTRIREIEASGTGREHALSGDEDHGFLWRLNTYWTYAERDGGLYIQIESVSMSHSIPVGLGWAVRPFVESVPRESLEFTLRSACAGVRR